MGWKCKTCNTIHKCSPKVVQCERDNCPVKPKPYALRMDDVLEYGKIKKKVYAPPKEMIVDFNVPEKPQSSNDQRDSAFWEGELEWYNMHAGQWDKDKDNGGYSG